MARPLWIDVPDHDAADGEHRILTLADHPEGFGPGFDRRVECVLDDGVWRDLGDGFEVGPIVAISPRAIYGRQRPPETAEEAAFRTRASDSAPTISAAPTAEALALAASMHGLRTSLACVSGALLAIGGVL